MPRNTSVTLGEHFSDFIATKIEQGRFESTSEAVRAGKPATYSFAWRRCSTSLNRF